MKLAIAIPLLCLPAFGSTNAPVTVPAVPFVSVVFEDEPTNIVAWKAAIDAQRAIAATNKPTVTNTPPGFTNAIHGHLAQSGEAYVCIVQRATNANSKIWEDVYRFNGNIPDISWTDTNGPAVAFYRVGNYAASTNAP